MNEQTADLQLCKSVGEMIHGRTAGNKPSLSLHLQQQQELGGKPYRIVRRAPDAVFTRFEGTPPLAFPKL
jgi:hypothetical protein